MSGISALRVDSGATLTLGSAMVIPVLGTVPTLSGFDPLSGPAAAMVPLSDLKTFFEGGTADEFVSTVAIATPSALTATQFTGFASTVSGAVLMGYGTTHDVALKNRAGTTVFGITSNTTDTTLGGTITVTAPNVTAASPATNVIAADGAITLAKAGSTIDGGGHSFYPVRGIVSVTATTTVKEAFAFGVRAGATIAGVIDQTSATRVGALFAKLDVSAATLTAGQVSVGWFDWGSAATTPTSTECNVVRLQNTTAAVINSLLYGYGKATFFADLSDNSGGWIGATAPTTLSGWLKVSVNGSTRYVALYTDPS